MKTKLIAFVCVLILFSSCGNNLSTKTKIKPDDPFKANMVKSQFFTLNPTIENTIAGTSGTVIALPHDCFLDANNEPITTPVKLELAEALSFDDILLSNLTTTSNGKPLETDGMIYINATTNGEQVQIDKSKPIYIEIPTKKRKAGMMAYKGTRDANGNMNWIDPKSLENYLVTIDLDLLNFWPSGFDDVVRMGMPFRNYTNATNLLIDSLFYSFASYEPYGFTYTSESNFDWPCKRSVENMLGKKMHQEMCDSISFWGGGHALNPLCIKPLKSKEFKNTFIATREFQQRIKALYSITDPEVCLNYYVDNLDKNLFELDSFVHKYVSDAKFTYYSNSFREFANQKLTNVKDGDKYAKQLKGFYEKKLKEARNEFDSLLKKSQQPDISQNELEREYKTLLKKREKNTMETYGFEWTELGWVNIDRGIGEKDWNYQKLDINIQNQEQFDFISTYVFYPTIKSLYRLNTNDNKHFFTGNSMQNEIPMPKKKEATVIAIAYQDSIPFFQYKIFATSNVNSFSLLLKKSNMEEVRIFLKDYDDFGKENSINEDLNFSRKLAAKQRLNFSKRQQETAFFAKLWNKVYPNFLVDSTFTLILNPFSDVTE